MAPSLQTQHVVAVTLPTIAVIFLTYLWYKKKRSSRVIRGKNDPGGGGGSTSRKRIRHRTNNINNHSDNNVIAMPSVTVPNSCSGGVTAVVNTAENFPVAMKNAMQKAIRDLETASPIQEICSDNEDDKTIEAETTTTTEKVVTNDDDRKLATIRLTNDIDRMERDEIEKSTIECDSMASHDTPTKTDMVVMENRDETRNTVYDNDNYDRVENESTTRSEILETSKVADVLTTNCCSVDHRTMTSLSPRIENDSEYENTSTINGKQSTIENAIDCLSDDNPHGETTIQSLNLSRSEETPKQTQQQRKTNIVSVIHPQPTNTNVTTATVKEVPKNDTATTTIGEVTSSSLYVRVSTSPSLSKCTSRKRKSKKRKTSRVCSNENEDAVVVANNETTSITATVIPAAVAFVKKITTDSKETKNDDACDRENASDSYSKLSKTAVTATKCAYSCRVPENGAGYNNSCKESTSTSSIRCRTDNVKKIDKSGKSDDYNVKIMKHDREDCDSERDSANNSPVDTILDCRSVQFSDAHSEGSSDSGKGCSEGAASPTPQTPAGGSSISGDQNVLLLFQFVIPQEHVGKLIGKQGQFINNIKTNSNTKIYIKKHPASYKKKICALEGTQREIQKALDLIRTRFPKETYPDITLEEFVVSLPMPCPLRPELFQLDLVEGVNNDVVISSVVNASHLFLQQPMHPTYQSLTLLNLSMNQVYNSPEAPIVLEPIKDNIVAAPAMGGWYRAQIVSVDDETESCQVRFLDYGGYLSLSTSCLKAVRADFLTLPFQAVECFLANVAPVGDVWSEEAKMVVQSLTYGHILQAQVYDYTSEGIPLTLLYAKHGTQVILINQELVARGFAYPITSNDEVKSEEYYVYSS